MPPSTPRGNSNYRGRGASPRGRGRGGPQSTSPRGRGRGRGAPGHAPPGICNFYWESGACRHGYDCRFRHETPPSSDAAAQEPMVEHDFFSPEGMAQNSGSVRSSHQNTKPQDAHNILKQLSTSLEFRSALSAESFAHVFGSVHASNPYWHFLDFVVQFFASGLVIKSTIHQNINKLYTLVEYNYSDIHNILHACLSAFMSAKTWKDRSAGSYLPVDRQDHLGGILVFQVVCTFLYEYFKLFKAAIRNHPEILDLVESLANWFDIWSDDVTSHSPNFIDDITETSPNVRQLTIDKLRKDVYRLRSVVRREAGVADEQRRVVQSSTTLEADIHAALVNRLELAYSPPGALRQGGPRHDNDFAAIGDIRIAPTHDELTAGPPPYLPVFVPRGPHHLPAGSMEKHLDIQFRLLREELTSSIRQAIAAINADLNTAQERGHRRTQLEALVASRGGAYRSTGSDSVFFHVYTNIEFMPAKAERRNFTVGLSLDSPPGNPRNEDGRQRADYWTHSKRLSQGSLVALMLVSRDSARIFLGTVACTSEAIAESSKARKDRIEIRVSFFDPEVELFALEGKRISPVDDKYKFALLFDNNVMYESMRPFLQTLQTIEPTSIPFADFIASEESLVNVPVPPPLYALVPGFRFQLTSLLPPRSSTLDPSQASTIIDALTRQICLVQGPPGTGKSYTGKELLRVLLANNVKPIVLIAFTNHALDHMLLDVLEARITSKMVRLGSRSSDERIAQYNLSKLEEEGSDETSPLGASWKRHYRRMKDLEDDMHNLMDSIQIPIMHWTLVQSHLRIYYPEVEDQFLSPPVWISNLREWMLADEEAEGEWQVQSKKNKKAKEARGLQKSIYGFWKGCHDIKFLDTVTFTDQEGEEADDPRSVLFASLGYETIPPSPSTISSRKIDDLLSMADPWSMNTDERHRLAKVWEGEIRRQAYQSQVAEFEDLRRQYQEVCSNLEDIKNQTRQTLLGQVDLIGCTTTAPKVLVVEEAGQVLESHILASLVPSVEHLICIGDPEQLRPTLANYGLSMDSERGNRLFKFDRSLLERLSSNGCAMSLINVQRRMRPSISKYPRLILYPALQDHERVEHYPPVQGMLHNVFFFSHTNAENAERDSVSKFNVFEANMIKDLVLYFLKQGCYSGKGDIAVLCAYLGQLQQVRKALQNARLAVVVNERDAEALEREGEEVSQDPEFEDITVAKHIRLGTVDTFQGEEAKIVIISLVRNSGDFSNDASIGFLKSSNRINVALSRAQHGMYLLGNASNLRRNATWAAVLEDMEQEGLVGSELPIVCPRHPEQVRMISRPGQIPFEAPEGGCLARCEFQLSCGHTCPSVCHPDLDQHARMKCHEPCQRITCPRQHPCSRECGDNCGLCQFPMYKVLLPCGHIKAKVFCHEFDDLQDVQCNVVVEKTLPHCEHTASVPCHREPESVRCRAICKGIMACCSRACSSTCDECCTLTTAALSPQPSSRIPRTTHRTHPCERLLYCQHRCGRDCSQDHECNNTCSEKCRQTCSHHSCKKPCSEPCPPCMEPCSWMCGHGNICARLPCNEPCLRRLKCGTFCGEPCDNQTCPECLSDSRKTDIVDFIMQRTLAELDLTSPDIGERIITLQCGHFFTVESLDGHCHIRDYYEVDELTGSCVGMKEPPTDFQNPPSCPTCRGPITALRYGRITKRATLDILERNVASMMTKMLNEASLSLREINAESMDKLKERAKAMKVAPPSVDLDLEALATLRQKEYTALEKSRKLLPTIFLLNAPRTGFSSGDTKEWRVIIDPLITLAAIHEDTERISDEPETDAMRAVDAKMGQPPHRADMRYQVEAFFMSIDVRVRIAQIARARFEGLPGTANAQSSKNVWRSFIRFIYESCIGDARKARDIASASSATRQVAKCDAYIVHAEMFAFGFGIVCEVEDYVQAGRLTDDVRQSLSEKEYMAKRSYKNTQEGRVEREWFDTNCRVLADGYIQDYKNLKEHVMTNKGYSPLSLEEKQEIVKAFNFGYRGHFYNCPNGHPFVITECGGATQVSRCPECDAEIGGTGHTLLASNTRAMEFENVSREQGGREPHWAWGQGA
ncbi:P-loop containing nucleoside triphosphate hydrolase protein [Hymenopellis radicata]|nr:P-loop containing nucleoside triphosphate hydrolase protein [Hymenopellis radicata]